MRYLTDQENLANLELQLSKEERKRYRELKPSRIEAAFLNRLFLVFSVEEGEPNIITTIKVTDFWINAKDGAVAVLEDLETGQEIEIDYAPIRLFEFDAFMSIPPISKIRWDARLDDDNIIRRNIVFPVLIAAKSRNGRMSSGGIYVETPKRFMEKFPGHTLPLRHI